MIKAKIAKIYLIFLLFLVFIPLLQVNAKMMKPTSENDIKEEMIQGSGPYAPGLPNDEPGELLSTAATNVVSAVLGLLGIIFLVIVIIGGFNWMTAAGNEAKVTKAKATLVRGIVGLFIVVAAYVITIFVFNALGGIVGRE